MMNPIKFASHNLDIPSSRYEFLKHVFKSVKTNKKNQRTDRLTDGAAMNRACSLVRPAQGTAFDRRELADGEVSGDEVTSVVFLSTSRIE